MTTEADKIHGMSLAQWNAVYRPGMPEFAAHTFTFLYEEPGLLRVAFGNGGPFIDTDGGRAPVFTHAVTMTPALAVELARLLLKHCAQPEAEKAVSSAELS
jgi:hypothetical protein